MHRRAPLAAATIATVVALVGGLLPASVAAVGPRTAPQARFHRLDVKGIDPQLLPAMLRRRQTHCRNLSPHTVGALERLGQILHALYINEPVQAGKLEARVGLVDHRPGC